MHRRQYIPHSQHKISRRLMLADRENLVNKIDEAKRDAEIERHAREEAEKRTFTAKVRSIVGKVKRVFTTPINLSR